MIACSHGTVRSTTVPKYKANTNDATPEKASAIRSWGENHKQAALIPVSQPAASCKRDGEKQRGTKALHEYWTLISFLFNKHSDLAAATSGLLWNYVLKDIRDSLKLLWALDLSSCINVMLNFHLTNQVLWDKVFWKIAG